jgi:thiol:disulfide interchange protein
MTSNLSSSLRHFRRGVLLPLLLGVFAPLCANAIEEDELLPVEEAYVPTVTVANDVATVSFKVAPGYYLYKERTALEAARPEEVVLGALVMPEGQKKTDEFFGEMHVFHQDFSGTATLSYPGPKPVLLGFRLKYQGCADIGVCYPPQTRTFAMASGAPLPGIVDAAAVETASAIDAAAGPQQTLPGALASGTEPSANGTGMISGITQDSSEAPSALSDPAPVSASADPLGLSGANAPSNGLLAQGDALPEDQAFRAQALATDGQTVLVRISAPPDYYLYRDKFAFVLSSDGVASSAVYPAGQMIKDEHFGDVEVYFGGVDIPLTLSRTSAAPAKATLAIEFQGCKKDSVCYPVMRRVMTLDLPSGVAGALPAAPAVAALATQVSPEGDTAKQTVPVREPGAQVLPQLLSPGIVLAAIERAVSGVAPAAATPENVSDVGLLLALLLALGGGVLLNLMPCVLPVLSLKILGLLESGNSPKAARTQAIFYTAGVLASFFALGLILLSFKSAGAALGWGFQLQSPLVVGALAFLLIAMGLNLSGVVSFGHSLGNVGANLTQSGARGAFFSGVLACIVATPCTGPGMFTALGYGFTQSNTVAMLILLTLGLGLALPFLLIGFIPALAKMLPRPGAWMETLKTWMAFPLYLTAVWLLSVLGRQTGVDGMAYALAGAVLLGAGLWWWDRQRYSTNDSTVVATLFALALVGVSVALLHHASGLKPQFTQNLAPGQVPYSSAALAQLRAKGTPVFVDMTAAWCITCKVNEKNAINTFAVGKAMQENGVVYMVGDYTNSDPAITAYLKAYGAVGVPLYVMYPKVSVAH